MTVQCSKCSTEVPAADVNVSANVAYCRRCNEAFPLSELPQVKLGAPDAWLGPPPEIDLNQPPPGVRYEQTFDGVVVSATTRSCIALFLVPFTCFWAVGALTGIAKGLSQKFDPGLCLFAIPFVLGALLLLSYSLMTLFGRVELRLRGDDGEIFTGVGPLGWTKRFKLSDVTSVGEVTHRTSKGGRTRVLVIEAGKSIEFASMLTGQRREFMLAVLKKVTGKR